MAARWNQREITAFTTVLSLPSVYIRPVVTGRDENLDIIARLNVMCMLLRYIRHEDSPNRIVTGVSSTEMQANTYTGATNLMIVIE